MYSLDAPVTLQEIFTVSQQGFPRFRYPMPANKTPTARAGTFPRNMPYRLIRDSTSTAPCLNTHGVILPRDWRSPSACCRGRDPARASHARWYQAAVRPFEALGLRGAAIASAGSDIPGRRRDGPRAGSAHSMDFAASLRDLCDRAGLAANLAVPSKAYRRANELPPWAANAPE